jgi:hypothetical protein
VTAPLLAPLIPSSRVPEARQRPGSATGGPLPLAHPEPVPPAPEDVVYGIGRIDAGYPGWLRGAGPAAVAAHDLP